MLQLAATQGPWVTRHSLFPLLPCRLPLSAARPHHSSFFQLKQAAFPPTQGSPPSPTVPSAHAPGSSTSAAARPTVPHPHQLAGTQQHDGAPASSASSAAAPASTAPLPDTVWSLPNMLSVARGVSGPFIAYLILQEQWPWALGALAVSGMSDWADGALARRMGTSSVLGSYLDPLGDKVLVGCVVGALAAQGALPSWVATLIIGRDVALVSGMFVLRWRSLGWRTPWSAQPLTRTEFFRTADETPSTQAALRSPYTTSSGSSTSSSSGGGSSTGSGQGKPAGNVGSAAMAEQQPQPHGAGVAGPTTDAGVPFMRPLMISKVNTVLQLTLVAGCVSRAWLSWPQADALAALESSTAGATALSMLAYGWQATRGRLLSKPSERGG